MHKITAALAFFTAAFLASCTSTNSKTASSSGKNTREYWGDKPGPQGFRTVVIDAGHGGKDSGAPCRYNGAVEKNLALNVARDLRSELAGRLKVVMMRDSDTFVELDERAARASKYSDGILVSIHWNSSAFFMHGPETYYWRVDSHGLATRVEQNLNAATGSSNSRGLVRRRLRLTRNPEVPSILVECGYLSNKEEAARAIDASYQHRIAKAIASAIIAQAAQGDAGTGELPKSIHAPPSKNSDRRE